jgi:transposase
MDAAIGTRQKGPPPAVTITITPEERAVLEHLCRAGTTERRLVDRAQLVLLAVLGCGNMAIAGYLHRSRYWVVRWRRRFARERLAGLADRPRSGRPRRLSPLQRIEITALACTPPEEAGRAWVRWSVQALHDEIERRHMATLHPSTVHRILDAADLQPHHLRYWRHAIAPDFEEKAASVLWFYERATWLAERDELVVCVDEKTQIQALRRPVPDLGMLSGRDRRREWEYQRDGTVNPLAVYTLMTGRVWGRVLLKNDHAHFIESMDEYLTTVPRTIRCIHCILDNGSSHIAKVTQAWLAAQDGRVMFHFTPAHASWVNQAELALSAFSRRYLRDRVSASRTELITHIEQALEEYNRFFAHPFTWSFTRHAMHQWYCQRTSAMVH